MCVLEAFQKGFGQLVNLMKSRVSFTRNVPKESKNIICNRMSIKTVSSHTRYLGLPVVFGRFKKEVFAFMVDPVCKKHKGWKDK